VFVYGHKSVNVEFSLDCINKYILYKEQVLCYLTTVTVYLKLNKVQNIDVNPNTFFDIGLFSFSYTFLVLCDTV
jgi:hypothetical protein